MRLGVLLITIGCACLAGAVGIHVNMRRIQELDIQDIRGLRAILDSTRVNLARAKTAADSAVLSQQIQQRQEALGYRDFHVPLRQAQLEGWWRPTGPGVLGVVAGALLLLGGLVALRRQKGAT